MKIKTKLYLYLDLILIIGYLNIMYLVFQAKLPMFIYIPLISIIIKFNLKLYFYTIFTIEIIVILIQSIYYCRKEIKARLNYLKEKKQLKNNV